MKEREGPDKNGAGKRARKSQQREKNLPIFFNTTQEHEENLCSY